MGIHTSYCITYNLIARRTYRSYQTIVSEFSDCSRFQTVCTGTLAAYGSKDTPKAKGSFRASLQSCLKNISSVARDCCNRALRAFRMRIVFSERKTVSLFLRKLAQVAKSLLDQVSGAESATVLEKSFSYLRFLPIRPLKHFWKHKQADYYMITNVGPS